MNPEDILSNNLNSLVILFINISLSLCHDIKSLILYFFLPYTIGRFTLQGGEYMPLFSPVPRRSFPPGYSQNFGPPYPGQQFGPPYQGQQLGQPYQRQPFGLPFQGQQFGQPYQGQPFGSPFQGQPFGQPFDNRGNQPSSNNSSPSFLGNLPNHINTLAGHATTIQNGYNMMRQLGSMIGLIR